jgi:hypothetical protein
MYYLTFSEKNNKICSAKHLTPSKKAKTLLIKKFNKKTQKLMEQLEEPI